MLRAFVEGAALLTQISRCKRHAALSQALGYELGPMRGMLQGSDLAIRARVQPAQGFLLAEEIYPRRFSWQWADPAQRASLLLVQQGRCIVEAPGLALQMLQAGGTNALAITASAHDITITQAPCRLVRLVLPAGSLLQAPGSYAVDLALMVPMLQLLEQALHHPAGAHTRDELAGTLLAYLLDRLAAGGCVVQLPPATGAVASSEDALEQLEQWLPQHLSEPLELADLAAAVNLSPRRLQELCRARHGCSPMDFLRRQRLALLANQLRDPNCAKRSLKGLLSALQLSDSASTRQAFARLFGCSLAEFRRGARTVAAV